MKTYNQQPNLSKNPETINFLESVVKKLTPKHMNVVDPSFNPKLMKAHYLLTLQHLKDGNPYEAMTHFSQANNEFNNALLNEHKIRDVTRFTTNEKEENKRFNVLKKYQETLGKVSHEIYSNEINTSFYFHCNPLFASLKPKTKESYKV